MQAFIRDAILGGWKGGMYHSFDITKVGWIRLYVENELGGVTLDEVIPVTEALLDIFAWRAVGQVRRWEPRCYICKAGKEAGHRNTCPRTDWDERVDLDTPRGFMHQFIDHLADGWALDKALQMIHQRVLQ